MDTLSVTILSSGMLLTIHYDSLMKHNIQHALENYRERLERCLQAEGRFFKNRLTS